MELRVGQTGKGQRSLKCGARQQYLEYYEDSTGLTAITA